MRKFSTTAISPRRRLNSAVADPSRIEKEKNTGETCAVLAVTRQHDRSETLSHFSRAFFALLRWNVNKGNVETGVALGAGSVVYRFTSRGPPFYDA